MKTSIGAKTVAYPTPVFVVGTYDKAGRPNVMTASWAGICCSVPPCVTVSLRKATYSYHNIVEQKCFTVNLPSASQVAEADYFGLVSGKTDDKFLATGLTPVKSKLVNAPYVGEFPFVLECALRQTVELGLHTQFIGEILDIKVDENILSQNGLTDIEKLKPILFDPERQRYYGVGEFLGNAFSIGNRVGQKK